MSILKEIFQNKEIEVEEAQKMVSYEEIEKLAAQVAPPPDFLAALNNKLFPAPRLIAEVKQKSPSKGLLSKDFDPITIAKSYLDNGASAISVLTDHSYFGGSLENLHEISKLNMGIPLLRKDFIFSEYQILEAKYLGASAALLLSSYLEEDKLIFLVEFAIANDIEPLVEVHNDTELTMALNTNTRIIGINNRDLHTFEVSLETSLKLKKLIPDHIVTIAESGIHSLDDISKLRNANFDAILIGEALMTAEDPQLKIREFSRMYSG